MSKIQYFAVKWPELKYVGRKRAETLWLRFRYLPLRKIWPKSWSAQHDAEFGVLQLNSEEKANR